MPFTSKVLGIPKHNVQTLRTTALIMAALTALIAAPVLYATWQMEQLGPLAIISICAGAIGIALTAAILRTLPRTLAPVCVVLLVATSLIIRFTYLGLIQFSGVDFNAEFFLHLGTEAVAAAWRMYGWWLVIGLGAIATYLTLACAVALRLPRPPATIAIAFLFIGIGALISSRAQMPEYQLASTGHQMMAPVSIQGHEELKQRWQNSPLVNTELTPKSKLVAQAAAAPRNLILVYLESVGLPVINHPDWPDLMPNLAQLVRDHSLTEFLYTSSFVTIEGLVNSQCGTLFPFDRGGDSLANGHNLAGNLPCLADVLAEAGYQNRYLGGAGMAFAGKGLFLQAHGFVEPMGLIYWRDQGISQRPGTWGVSDADLFAQALEQYKSLSASDEPFNITLLTIGAHLPGFYYEECKHYSASDDPFLDALHCTDQLLHHWLQQLEALGAFEDTTVVITADHHVFGSPDMKNLFGETIWDRRLPLIVLGQGADIQAAATGAGYDLAPTVLDLLGIQHNANFALGRSLIKSTERRPYYLSRYNEVYNNQVHANSGRSCPAQSSSQDTILPIPTACQRDDLFSLLRRQVESLSLATVAISCENKAPLTIEVPEAAEEQPLIQIHGRDFSHNFSQEGRRIEHPSGLYLLWFDANGRLENTEYASADSAATELRKLPQSDITKNWVAIWIAPGDTSAIELPEWLGSGFSASSNSIYLGKNQASKEIHWTADKLSSTNGSWQLSRDLCEEIF